MGHWSHFSGYVAFTLHAADSVVYSLPCILLLSRDERNSARCICHMWAMSHRPFDRRNNDYVTAFLRPPVEDLQPCATDVDSGLCNLLNAHHRVTITHRHTDATDSPMFSLAAVLPISDVRCANRPNSNKCGFVQYVVCNFIWKSQIFSVCRVVTLLESDDHRQECSSKEKGGCLNLKLNGIIRNVN